MSDEDMPDLALGAPLAGEGAADDVLNEVDELENLLEDALDERFAKGAQAGPPGVEVIQAAEETGTAPGDVSLKNSLENLPRSADGTIDVASLTPEQHRTYTAEIMGLLTEDQLSRYEMFRRSKLTEPMRRLVQIVTGTKPDSHNRVLIALSSVTKSFVGELVEAARKVAEAEGESAGPLRPAHVHAALVELKDQGKVESIVPGRKRVRL